MILLLSTAVPNYILSSKATHPGLSFKGELTLPPLCFGAYWAPWIIPDWQRLGRQLETTIGQGQPKPSSPQNSDGTTQTLKKLKPVEKRQCGWLVGSSEKTLTVKGYQTCSRSCLVPVVRDSVVRK